MEYVYTLRHSPTQKHKQVKYYLVESAGVDGDLLLCLPLCDHLRRPHICRATVVEV